MVELPTDAEPVRVVEGEALDLLRALPSASIDSVVTDPPYPMIDREYGRWTEAEWFALMDPVVEECRRVLKSTGSAVFVLQPNSERVGRMRTWLWKFMAKWGDEWGQVQDVYWWNHETLPKTRHDPHLLRPSLKPCVWLGPADCYRDGDAVVWAESMANRTARMSGRCTNKLQTRVSRVTVRDERARTACVARGGVTSFNVLPIGVDGKNGAVQHAGRTPDELARWWVRYITPPGGTVLDPFLGSGTTALAALAEGRLCVGSERFPKYAEIARRRVREAMGTGLLTGV